MAVAERGNGGGFPIVAIIASGSAIARKNASPLVCIRKVRHASSSIAVDDIVKIPKGATRESATAIHSLAYARGTRPGISMQTYRRNVPASRASATIRARAHRAGAMSASAPAIDSSARSPTLLLLLLLLLPLLLPLLLGNDTDEANERRRARQPSPPKRTSTRVPRGTRSAKIRRS